MILPMLCAAALGATPVESLHQSLDSSSWSLADISRQNFANLPLSRKEAADASKLLWDALSARLKNERKSEWDARSITIDGKTMKFDFRIFGAAPPPESKSGRRLFISMHGGGETSAKVNDQQWRNQIRLYTPDEGIYLAPRAPTDSWNMWHQSHIDRLFDRIIEDAMLFEGVDPNRVYLMGYSAGGDGVYQLAPRMADRFAAASMMAGHPNESTPLGLRNLPFAIHVGELDTAFNRNTIAKDWEKSLDALAKADPGGYIHHVEVHPGKAHWMDREDASAVPWMAAFSRRPLPDRIVWKQDDVTHLQFYWLAADGTPKPGDLLDVSLHGVTFTVAPQSTTSSFWLLLNDELLDLDSKDKISVRRGDDVLHLDAARTISSIVASLSLHADPGLIFTARVKITLPAPPAP